MRRFFLISLTITSILALPRIADRFREPRPEQKSKPAQPAAGNTSSENHTQVAEPAHEAQSAAVNTQQLPAANPLAVAHSPVLPDVPAAGAIEPPAPQEDIVIAIKRELSRLKLYDGPLSQYWNRPVRMAARKFVRQAGLRVRYGKPSQQLLRALESTKADPRAPAGVDAMRLDMQVTQSLPEAAEGAAGQPGSPDAAAPWIVSNGYLPPWQEHGSADGGDNKVAREALAGEDAGRDKAGTDAAASQDAVPAIRRSRHTARSRKRYRTARVYRQLRSRRAFVGLHSWRYRRPYYFSSANYGWGGQ
jgi:hypothetical protein